MRIQQSPVIQTDWLNEVRAGRAFARSTGLAAVAAQYGHIQLFNPASSGVIALVKAVAISAPADSQLVLYTYNTELTTNVDAGTNLDFGGAASVCRIRRQTDVAQLGTGFLTLYVSAGDTKEYPMPWIGKLGEGEGLQVVDNAVNNAFNVGFAWAELPQ